MFIESFALPPRMIIFGAVDFTAALAKVAKVLGYRVTVCDARAVFATVLRFPMADEVVNDWPDRYLAKVGDELGPRDAVCVLTHDHKFDVPAIAARGADRRRLPRRDGFAAHARPAHGAAARGRRRPRPRSHRVMSPIGLDIGARTPEETAVAICAEIIALRTGRRGAVAARHCGPHSLTARHREEVARGSRDRRSAGRGRGRVEGTRASASRRRSRPKACTVAICGRSRDTVEAAAARHRADAVPIVADVVARRGRDGLRARRPRRARAASTSSCSTRAARRRATSRTRRSTSTSTRSS